MLLFLLQRTLKASGAGGQLPQQRQTLFGRMTQGLRSSLARGGLSFGVVGGLDSLRQVETKSPALLFKLQLTAYVKKIYGMIRDNLKKEIAPLLTGIMKAPTSKVRIRRQNTSVHATPQQIMHSQWHNIIESLSNLSGRMLANHVSAFFVRKVFTQIFSFINVELFNSVLLRRECCSFSYGENLKEGLAKLELWDCENAGSAWDELRHIRQAVGFLVIRQKTRISLDELTHDVCPVLSIQQLYRISTMYWPDGKYGTHCVSFEVLANMRVLMTEDSRNSVSNSFLLDDDKSIPFSVDDISRSMPETDLSDVPPPVLLENRGFLFLVA